MACLGDIVPLLAAGWVLALCAVLVAGVKTTHVRWPQVAIALYLLLWATLIVTSHLLSLFAALGETALYAGTSLAVATTLAAGLRMIRPLRGTSREEWPCTLSPRVALWLAWLLAASMAGVVFSNLLLAYGMLPANPDSIVYRFPRAYWFFSQGSLKHFNSGGDPRPLFYPFNATLAYLPLVHFRLDPRFFSLPSLLSWLVIGGVTFLFARDFGGNRLFAAATAWIVCLTPNVLLQALSGNDEIIAAAPLVTGLYFAHRWFRDRQKFDAVLAAVGVGISAGTKLHLSFYWPLLLFILVMLAIYWRAVLIEAFHWADLRGVAVLISMMASFAVCGLGFLAYNYSSTGHLMDWEFAAQVLNKPFNVMVALQTIVLFTSQIVLTPIADLHIVFNTTLRAQHYESFNYLVAPLFSWVQNGPTYVSAFYRFTGVNTTSSVVFNEHTIFIGFTWIVTTVAALRLARRPPSDALWGRFHLAALFAFFFTYAATTRYIEGCAVYIAYAVIVSGPPLIYAFAPISDRRLDHARWGLLAFVGATHCFFAVDIFLTSSPRNMIILARGALSSSLPLSRGFATDASVLDEIRRAQAGVYHRTIAWGQPYWAFMASTPEIRHLFASNPKEIPNPRGESDSDATSAMLRFSRYVLMPPVGDRGLYIYSFPKQPAWGRAAIRIPDKASAGLTWIGDVNFSLGPEWVFAVGNDVAGRHPGRDRYVVLTFAEQSNFGHDPKPVLNIDSTIYGLGADDELSFRYEMLINGRLHDRTDWSKVPQAHLNTAGLSAQNGVLVIFIRNDNGGGTVTTIDVALRSRRVPEALSGR